MNVTIAMTAALYGATVVNHAEVDELVKDSATGRITGVRVKDLLSETGRDGFLVRAKVSLPLPSLLHFLHFLFLHFNLQSPNSCDLQRHELSPL